MARRAKIVEGHQGLSIEELREIYEGLADHPLNISAFSSIMPKREMIERGLYNEGIIMARIKHQTTVINDKAGEVPVWTTSSPTRGPTHSLSISYGGGQRLSHQGFCHVFAAKKILEALLDETEWKWIDPTMIEVELGDVEFKIKSNELEEIVEYEYRSNAERSFVLPMPYAGYVRRIRGGSMREPVENRPQELPEEPRAKRRDKPPAKRRPASGENLVTASDLAVELKTEPRLLRMALRKQFKKPDHGWAWSREEADRIKKEIKLG